MDGRGEFFLVMFVVFILAVAWFITGGPQRSVGEGPFLSPPPPLGTGGTYGWGFVPKINFGGLNIFSGSSTTQNQITRYRDEFDELAEFGDPSPYRDRITLSSYGGTYATKADEEYITIEASSSNTNPIRISGFKLESAVSGVIFPIGNATRLPRSGIVNDETPVFLGPGESAIITTGRSPTGSSFRTNLCTGYFEQFQDFNPSLRRECPLPSDELPQTVENIRAYGSSCFDFIDRLSRCAIVTQALPLDISNSCSDFMAKHFSYNGCIDTYRNQPDFFKSEWRIFLGRSDPLWRDDRELIRLLDESGKTIDVLSY